MTSQKQRVAIVTGANTGIGFEIVAQLAAKTDPTYHVYLGSRSIERGQAALSELQSRDLPGTIELVHLDYTDDATIEQAALQISATHGHIDIIVNNGIFSNRGNPTTRATLRKSFDANVIGPWSLVAALAPLLRKSTLPIGPRIVNISTGAGSIVRRLNKNSPTYNGIELDYRLSKAAFNMLAACHMQEFQNDGIKVLVFNPGYTENSWNRVEDGATPVRKSVGRVVDVIEGKRDSEEGTFLNYEGTYPW